MRLEVLDLLGRVVKELLNEELPAGAHTAGWDGTDGRGVRGASGPYIVRLTAGSQSAFLKIALLR